MMSRSGPVRRSVIAAGVLVALLVADGVRPGAAQEERSTWDGVFNGEQAARGAEIYGGMCASCHGPQLGGIDAAPALNGGAFFANWNGIALAEMADRVRRTMPANAPGVMTRQQVVDVMAYIFSRNGMPSGEAELPRQTTLLRGIVFRPTRGDGGPPP
ncbi:MAG TPA: c-type cytochrome [Longimicrobiales bacterium]|jgi:mono/diheme cytochrome c family protein